MMLLEFVIASAVAAVIQCIDCYDDSASVPSHPVSCEASYDACFVEYISLVSQDETVKDEWNRFCTYSLACRHRNLDNKCLKLHQLSPLVQESIWSKLLQGGKISNRSLVRERNSHICCCSSRSLCNDMTLEELAIMENASMPATSLRTDTLNIAISVSPPPTSICLLNLLGLFMVRLLLCA